MRSLIVLAALAMATPCSAADYVAFRSPSGAIGCGYYEATLRCDVEGGIKPLPPQPAYCQFDWGTGYNLRAHGMATIVCAGDTSRDMRSTIVPYGSTWKRGSISCASSPNGMRCTNADHHGFLISRGEAYRF